MMGDMIKGRRRRGGLVVSAAQSETCRRFSTEPSVPAPYTMIGIALSQPRDLLPLNALRHPVIANSNGWFVWRGPTNPEDEADDFFSPIHIEHLGDHAPELAPYLALPPGWLVTLAPGHEYVWYDEALLDV
jgi:hypothetical protein